MTSKLTITCFQEAANRFVQAEAEVLSEWKPPCHCSVPGGRRECQSCPYCVELIGTIQKKLHPHPENVFPSILVPECLAPYSDLVKQQCLELRRQGYSLTRISQLTGMNDRPTLKKWLEGEGLLKGLADCKESDKQHCIKLYEEGKSPTQIEDELGIKAEIVSIWVHHTGDNKSQVIYTPEQRQTCMSLYLEGKEYKEIETMTGVKAEAVRYWAREAGVCRKKSEKGGRPSPYSQELRDSCRKLLEEGQTPAQVAQKLNLGVTTVRRWMKSGFSEPST